MKAIDLNESSKEAFYAAIKENKPALFLCYADWCGHCRSFLPTWQRIKKSLQASKDINVVEVSYDHMELLPRALQNIRGFPTIQIVRNGKVSKEYQGDREHDAIVSFTMQQVNHKSPVSAPAKLKRSTSPSANSTLKKKKVKTI